MLAELLVTALLPANIELVLPLLLLVVGAGLASLDAPPKMELFLAAVLVSLAIVVVVAPKTGTPVLAVVALTAKIELDEGAAGRAGLASLAAPPNMLELDVGAAGGAELASLAAPPNMLEALLPPKKDFEAVALLAVEPKTDFVEACAAVVAASPNAGFEVSLPDLPDKKKNNYNLKTKRIVSLGKVNHLCP